MSVCRMGLNMFVADPLLSRSCITAALTAAFNFIIGLFLYEALCFYTSGSDRLALPNEYRARKKRVIGSDR